MLVLASLGLVGLGIIVRVSVWPPSDEPAPGAPVVVLSGDFGDRLPVAKRIVAEGLAPVLVHAGTPDSREVLRLCAGEQRIDAEVICVQPERDSTQAEARAVALLARGRRWTSLTVVTSNYHLVRAQTWFGQCFDGEVRMVGTDPVSFSRVWVKQVLHEWGGLSYLAFHRGC